LEGGENAPDLMVRLDAPGNFDPPAVATKGATA